MPILIELESNRKFLLDELSELAGENSVIKSQKSFDGISEVAQILVPLTTVIMAAATKVVSEEIKARRHVTIKWKGSEITGISEKSVASLLEELHVKEKKKLSGKK